MIRSRYLSHPTPLQAETTALVARMTTPPSATRKQLINRTIYRLKREGVWPKLTSLVLLAAHDSQAACLNWASTSYDAVPNSSPGFTVDRGYDKGAGIGYLNTQIVTGPAPWNNGSHTFGCYIQTRGTAGAYMGVENSASGSYYFIESSGSVYGYDGTQSGSVINFGAVAGTKHIALTRISSTQVEAVRDGAFVGTFTRNQDSSGSYPILVLGTLYNGTFNNSLQGGRVAAYHIGVGLTLAETQALNTILSAYMTAVGA